jgi:hypothetical protein
MATAAALTWACVIVIRTSDSAAAAYTLNCDGNACSNSMSAVRLARHSVVYKTVNDRALLLVSAHMLTSCCAHLALSIGKAEYSCIYTE